MIPKLNKVHGFGIAIFLIASVALVLWLSFRFVLPPKITSVLPVNLADRSAGLAFWSDRDGKFSVKILDDQTLLKTVSETNNESKAHLVEIGDLEPDKEYRWEILSSVGFKITDGKLRTRPLLRVLYTPKTVYGTLTDKDENLVANALVTMRRVFLKTSPQIQSDFLAATTNDSGNFVFDLSNLPMDKIPDGSEERLEIKVWTQDGKTKENLFVTTQTQPLPTIALD